MTTASVPGYAGRFLRVDLTEERLSDETFGEAMLRKYLGGTSLGARILYDEVPPGVDWSDTGNRFIIASGPLGGTRIPGSGSFSVVTKGALTGGATSSQANGFFGTYLRFSGYDGIIVQGKAKRWLYLYLHDGTAELRDASHLQGKDSWETEEQVKQELGKQKHELSVFSIGPAGENLVRLAGITGDEGHVAAHNGLGAIMGSKKLKAVAAARSGGGVKIHDAAALSATAREILDFIKNDKAANHTYTWGTSMGYSGAERGGWLPVKNYTTNLFPEHERFMGREIRSRYEIKRNPCWTCQSSHCHIMKVTDGPYAGYVGEEPEYEQWAAWGAVIGNTEPGAAVMLSNEVDRLGMDTNEAGWLIGLVMECYQKGILTKKDTDGLEMTWGNAEAARAMLRKIALRQGFGDILAEGIMRAARRLGGEVPNMAIHTMKGNTPRGHDHRALWYEMFDTCVSNCGTIEAHRAFRMDQLGLPAVTDQFSPEQVSTSVAKTKGAMQFEDSLVTCRFNTNSQLGLMAKAVSAATGWDFTVEEGMQVGRRAINLMRAFNIRHGLTPELDAPSLRYGSTPVDGPAKGKSIMPHWDWMRRNYYQLMGWDATTSKPLPETLRALGLEDVGRDLWGR